MQLISNAYPRLNEVVSAVLEAWPEHGRYIEKSLADRDEGLMRHTERLAAMVVSLAPTIEGGLAALATDYRFLAEKIVLPEEMHFRRFGTYRLKTFEEADRTVYSDRAFMNRYMNGLLVSHIIWVNHCQGMQHYAEQFLPGLPSGANLLEIGPGHGLLLYLATQAENAATVSAWDVSQTSLDMSKHALEALGASRPVAFEMKNIFDPSIMVPENEGLFDAIVLSEVLEHMEDPEQAVRVLFHICRPNGRVWINVPANSPAPDHLYLVSKPQEAEALVEGVGFKIVDAAHYPMTGVTLEKAIAKKLTITCVIVGERP
jgi:2-polyprenyl-3-methyl-5-hydroxy-6-metoxy-1,4-benzoquinol methylase